MTSVSGTPTRQYSANPMRTPELRAASTTMRLATEPRIVKFPDSVDAIATSSHARVGSASCGTIGLNTSTAGTFDTRLESTAVSTAGRSRPAASGDVVMASARPVRSAPPVSTKSPVNSTSSFQSISR